MSINITNQPLIDKLEKIAKEENRSIENMAETVLLDFTKDYNGE